MTDKNMSEMTRARFTALVEAYGAEMGRWPEEQRLAAHAFSHANPDMEGVLSEAGAIDALLASSTVSLPEGLKSRVLAQCAMPQHSEWTLLRMRVVPRLTSMLQALWPGQALWKPATVFASALIMGAVLALNVSLPTTAATDNAAGDDVIALAAPGLAQDVASP